MRPSKQEGKGKAIAEQETKSDEKETELDNSSLWNSLAFGGTPFKQARQARFHHYYVHVELEISKACDKKEDLSKKLQENAKMSSEEMSPVFSIRDEP